MGPWTVLRATARGFVLAVVAALALVFGALLHLDLPAPRRLVADAISAACDRSFAGEIRIEHIAGLGLSGVDGVRVRVRDPDGLQVLYADGIRLRIVTPALVRSALEADGPLVVAVSEVSVGHVDVDLSRNAEGELRLAGAFERRRAERDRVPASGRGLRLDAPLVRLDHLWAHAPRDDRHVAGPLIDAEIAGLVGRVHLDTTGLPRAGERLRVAVDRARVLARALPYDANPGGELRAELVAPSRTGHGIDLDASFDGAIGGVSTRAEVHVEGRALDVRVAAQHQAGVEPGPLLGELPVREGVALRAEARGTLPHVELRAAVNVGRASLEAHARIDTDTPRRARGWLKLRDVDARAVLPGAPSTRLGLDARADLVLEADGLHGELRLDTLPGRIDDDRAPPASVRARLRGPSGRVTVRIADATMPTELRLDIARGRAAWRAVSLRARTRILDIARIPALGIRTHGRGELDFDGKLLLPEGRLEAKLRAVVADAGQIDLRADRLVLGGPIRSPSSWRHAHGRIVLAAMLDLDRLAALVPDRALPLADVRGTVSVRGTVARDGPTAPPEVQLHAHTNGLVLTARSAAPEHVSGVQIEAPPRWQLEGIDFGADLRTDGPSGLAGLSARATDRHGALVAFDAKAIVPFAALAAAPSTAEAHLRDAPVRMRVMVPRRQVEELPAIPAIRGARGAIEADLEASGTLVAPRIRLVARTRALRTGAMPPRIEVDTDAVLTYAGERAELAATVTSHGQELLHADARVDGSLRDVARGRWHGSASARLTSFPLESVPQLADRRIRGRLDGEVVIDDLHRDARARGRMRVGELAVGDAESVRGSVVVEAGGGQLAFVARVEQADGFLDARLDGGLRWGAAVVPALDREQPIEASVVARALHAAALEPFLGRLFPVVAGRIDADARAHLAPGTARPDVEGRVALRSGTLQIAALGEELRDVRARAAFERDGSIRIEDVYARGTQGELRADATATLEGTRLVSGTANVRIPDRKPLSLALQGQPVGEVSGTMRLDVVEGAGPGELHLAVDVARLDVELPQSRKRGLQSLEEKENVRVGVFRDGHKLVRLPLEEGDVRRDDEERGIRLVADVRFGRVRIARGNQLRASFSGSPRLVVEHGKTRITGRIALGGGWIDVQGKRFDIERGTITFGGETPPNPVVVATAAWTAADATRVYADFVGPMRTGKIRLRSEPPRPKNEILALVLFGTTDGANPQPMRAGSEDGAAKAAVGLGGGLVARGLTEALDDLAGIQATARIDTTHANNPRPEVEIQLSPRVSISFAHVLGTPPIAEPDRNFASLEYRFHRNWSLETTFGDRGTALLDAIWQKRY